jgi:hypothetical protein
MKALSCDPAFALELPVVAAQHPHNMVYRTAQIRLTDHYRHVTYTHDREEETVRWQKAS